MWLKFDMIERLIQKGGYDWIWWIDFDTLITNTSTPLTSIIDTHLAKSAVPSSIDYLITHDWLVSRFLPLLGSTPLPPTQYHSFSTHFRHISRLPNNSTPHPKKPTNQTSHLATASTRAPY